MSKSQKQDKISNISFIHFLQFCLDGRQAPPELFEQTDWDMLFRFCQQQAITGIGFTGIEKLKQENVDIDRKVLLRWYAMAERIKQRNKLLNKRCIELTEMLRKDGFMCCILKGQGNTLMCCNHYCRMPGDIDVFVLPEGEQTIKERRQIITNYVKKRFQNAKIRYQHIDYPIFQDVTVEMHFIPIAMNNPIHNQRIQRWAEERMETQCQHYVDLPDGIGKMAVPTTEFNTIYQLSHLMHHFFDEGIGIKQMIDYYYVLKQRENCKDRFEEMAFENTLKHLGLWKFAGAVMYVMNKVLGLEKQYLIAPIDEQRGQTLLTEIIRGGNFGRFSGLTQHSTASKYFLKIARNMHFVKEYPAEALWEPVFRTWHFFWRIGHRW